jgi:hypothetical protein
MLRAPSRAVLPNMQHHGFAALHLLQFFKNICSQATLLVVKSARCKDPAGVCR